jgi:hypothetical protein
MKLIWVIVATYAITIGILFVGIYEIDRPPTFNVGFCVWMLALGYAAIGAYALYRVMRSKP